MRDPNVPDTPLADTASLRKPDWLKVKVPQGERFNWIRQRAHNQQLHTVCEEARCPNIGECWQSGTATFMLMGDTCTRGCRFCSVKTARHPAPLDVEEPLHIAETIRAMELDYVVLTSVNRDDLPDQGAGHLAETIRRSKLASPELLIEILIPDFQGRTDLVDEIIRARPAVIAHNVETVERLQDPVRDPRAGFAQSLAVLHYAKQAGDGIRTKSSLMLGVGETEAEVVEAMRALRAVDVDFLTIGQYLQPDRRKMKVQRFVEPETFRRLEQTGLEMGFDYVASGPLVRSSYRAAEFFIARRLRQESAAPAAS